MDQAKKVTAWSPVEQVLRERVKSSIANFVTALDELIECDSVENRAKLRDMTHWLLRAGARDRFPWPAWIAAPNSSARSMGDPGTNSSACGKRRCRSRERGADAAGGLARDTRTRGKPRNPAVPSVGSGPPASAALAP